MFVYFAVAQATKWDTFVFILKVSFEKKIGFHMKEKAIKISDIKINVVFD